MVRIVSTDYLPLEARTPDIYGDYQDSYGEAIVAPQERTEQGEEEGTRVLTEQRKQEGKAAESKAKSKQVLDRYQTGRRGTKLL